MALGRKFSCSAACSTARRLSSRTPREPLPEHGKRWLSRTHSQDAAQHRYYVAHGFQIPVTGFTTGFIAMPQRGGNPQAPRPEGQNMLLCAVRCAVWRIAGLYPNTMSHFLAEDPRCP